MCNILYNLKYLFTIIILLKYYCIANLNPVILIPGDGGSQVEAKLNKTNSVHYICEKTTKDYFNIWLNMELLVPVVIDCWIDNIRLIYDNVTRTTRNPDGVDIRIPGFGGSDTVEWIDPSKAFSGAYFNKVADALVQAGHQRNITIKGAPYDFRKAPNENQEYFQNLKQLIEDTYEENNKTSVMIIAHSMGSPMSLYFLNQQTTEWKKKYIRRLVTLAGVWGGSVKALKVYAVGDDLGSYVLNQGVMRQEQITSPSLAWLLPSRLFWKPDEVLIQTDKKNFTIMDLEEFFDIIGVPDGWEMRKDTEPYQLNFKPPGVEVHCIYGTGVDTIERLFYAVGAWLDSKPTLIMGDGDGTVNRRSLEGCFHWHNLQKEKVHIKSFPKVDHMQILRDPKVLDYIYTLVDQKI